jgi:hypothetical protein
MESKLMKTIIILSFTCFFIISCSALVAFDDDDSNNNNSTTEICDNGLDDDGDGYEDCSDQDCVDDTYCLNTEVENCSNGLDDDGDGAVDCGDEDCFEDTNCMNPGCNEQNSWATASPFECEEGKMCTFVRNDAEWSIEPTCSKVNTSGHYHPCNGDLCDKGEVCYEDMCVPVCKEDSPPCPQIVATSLPVNASAICKFKRTNPDFMGLGYCVIETLCHPVVDDGCPYNMTCRVEIDSAHVNGGYSYCTSQWGWQPVGGSCESTEECNETLTCIPGYNICAKVCMNQEDCDLIDKTCEMDNNGGLGICI